MKFEQSVWLILWVTNSLYLKYFINNLILLIFKKKSF